MGMEFAVEKCAMHIMKIKGKSNERKNYPIKKNVIEHLNEDNYPGTIRSGHYSSDRYKKIFENKR